MNIELSYAEMSLLRELVGKKKLKIWRTVWLPHLANKSYKEIEEIYKKIMDKPAHGIATETDCCNMLLKRFQQKEEEIKIDLKSGEK